MPFEPIRKQRVAEQVAESIRNAILGGEFGPGDALPSERELAVRFGVNRSSIREALHRLEALNLIEMRHGGATLVRNFLVTAGLQLLPFLVAPGGVVNPSILRDVLWLRVVLSGWTAMNAAVRATPEDVERLDATVEAMEREDVTSERLQVLDFDFYQELVRLSDNQVLAMLVNAIRQVYFQKPELFRGLYEKRPFDTGYHRKVVEATARNDSKAAAESMEAYTRQALAMLGLAVEPLGSLTGSL